MTIPNDLGDNDSKRTIGTQTRHDDDDSSSEDESELERYLKKRIEELKRKVREVRETIGQQIHICPNALLSPNFHNETENIKQEPNTSCSHGLPNSDCDSKNTEPVNIKQEHIPSGSYAPYSPDYRSGNTESIKIQQEPIPSCSSHVPSSYYRSITTESENIHQEPIPSSFYSPSCSNYRSRNDKTNEDLGAGDVSRASEGSMLSDDEKLFYEGHLSDVPDYNMHPPGTDMTPIGKGNAKVPTRILKDLDASSYSVVTRKLLSAIFPRRVLATHSLSGKKSPAFPDRPAKERLNRKLVNDIIEFATRFCNKSEKYVRLAITTKCSDETRLFRKRRLNQKDRRSFTSDNKDESTSSEEYS